MRGTIVVLSMQRRIVGWGLSLVPVFMVAIVIVQQAGLPGTPMTGLTSRELELFLVGRKDFMEVETAEEELGPMCSTERPVHSAITFPLSVVREPWWKLALATAAIVGWF